eukprot:Tamp_08419.p1 GENE.Tamp_08419~~Tamp_08419.p1  ORF type:complete len:249 (-),score=48.90 Tamp_08419:1584-2330(-)
MAPTRSAVAALVLCVYTGGLAVSEAFQLHALPPRQLPPRPHTCPRAWRMAASASATTDNAAGSSHKFILNRTRALAKKNPEIKGNLIRILCNPTSEHYDKKVAEMWESYPKSERKIVLQKHEQQKLSWESTAPTPVPASSPPTQPQQQAAKAPQKKAASTPTISGSVSRTDAAKSPPDVADAYAQARAEQDAIAQIKQRFMEKIENTGRQATMRLKTMGELGLAAYQDGAKKANNLPDEVYIPPPSSR